MYVLFIFTMHVCLAPMSIFCSVSLMLGYRDGAGNTAEENSSVFSLIWMRYLPSVLWRCWLGGRKGIQPVKIWGDGGGGHWLVRMEWHPAGWSVCLPLLIFPCIIKSRSSLLAPALPGGPGKRAVKWLCVRVFLPCSYAFVLFLTINLTDWQVSCLAKLWTMDVQLQAVNVSDSGILAIHIPCPKKCPDFIF